MEANVNRINRKAVEAISNTLIGAREIEIKDKQEIGSLVFALLALGSSAVPVASGFISHFFLFLGEALFGINMKDIWDALRKPIEHLIEQKIDAYHLEVLETKIKGFQTNMQAFTGAWRLWHNATAATREQEAQNLKDHYTAFLTVLRGSIPEFQINSSAVAALPWFVMAANIHIGLLANGINYGASWGYTEEFIEGILRPEFNRLTVPSMTGSDMTARTVISNECSSNITSACPGDYGKKTELELLSNSIQAGEAHGWSEELLNTWRTAYSAMTVQRRDLLAEPKDVKRDYRYYIESQYILGRSKVRPYPPRSSKEKLYRFLTTARKFRAYADYDAEMIANVLAYTEFWPYLLNGHDMPVSVLNRLDREIFSGPYGNYTDKVTEGMSTLQVPWTDSTLPPVVPRAAGNFTSFIVRADEFVEGFQQRWGDDWSVQYGSGDRGVAHQVDLEPYEVVETIHIEYGQKIGSLRFTTNKRVHGPYGKDPWIPGSLGSLDDTVNRTGYIMSSAHVVKWPGDKFAGCEGIYFGFRPSLMNGDGPAYNASIEPVRTV